MIRCGSDTRAHHLSGDRSTLAMKPFAGNHSCRASRSVVLPIPLLIPCSDSSLMLALMIRYRDAAAGTIVSGSCQRPWRIHPGGSIMRPDTICRIGIMQDWNPRRWRFPPSPREKRMLMRNACRGPDSRAMDGHESPLWESYLQPSFKKRTPPSLF